MKLRQAPGAAVDGGGVDVGAAHPQLATDDGERGAVAEGVDDVADAEPPGVGVSALGGGRFALRLGGDNGWHCSLGALRAPGEWGLALGALHVWGLFAGRVVPLKPVEELAFVVAELGAAQLVHVRPVGVGAGDNEEGALDGDAVAEGD